MSLFKSKYISYFINLICPAFIFGTITGVITSLSVAVYKYCAGHIIHFSEKAYGLLQNNLWYIPAVLVVFFGVAVIFAFIYRKSPNLLGGGIPTSIGILRGIIRFNWLGNLVGVFFMSLFSFFAGVPLGNEGPSVQMGTAIGRGCVSLVSKKHGAWNRYSMTGGACAGFSSATGAPVSGILFAIEEAHQRISPMILITASVSVLSARITTEIVSPLLGIGVALFPHLELPELSVKEIWIPLVVGTVMGLFSVAFLKYYRIVNLFFGSILKKVPHFVKIFGVFSLTLFAGVFSYSSISTGHELILSLFEARTGLVLLAVILAVRSTLTLFANTNGITGGIFIPLLALGAVLSAMIGNICTDVFGLDDAYYVMILALGISSCISGMMKMPLTAVIFSVEALSCGGNILYVITSVTAAYIITEVFGAKSINDCVIDTRTKKINEGKSAVLIDTFVTVKENSFAVGKQIRDIFWPNNLFVLSVRRSKGGGAIVDEHGGKEIREGDTLHIRYSTYDEEETKKELTSIVGEQEYEERETDVV